MPIESDLGSKIRVCTKLVRVAQGVFCLTLEKARGIHRRNKGGGAKEMAF